MAKINVNVPIKANFKKLAESVEKYNQLEDLYSKLKISENQGVMLRLSILRDNIVDFEGILSIISSLRDEMIKLFNSIQKYDDNFLVELNKVLNSYDDSELSSIILYDIDIYRGDLSSVKNILNQMKVLDGTDFESAKNIVIYILKIDKTIPNINTKNKIYIKMAELLENALNDIMGEIYTYLNQGSLVFEVEE